MGADLRLALGVALSLAVVLGAGEGRAQTSPPSPPLPRSSGEGGSERRASKTIVLPTVVRDGDAAHKPTAADGELAATARGLDVLLSETAQDLGLAVDLTQRPTHDAAHLAEADLLDQAKATGDTLVVPSVRALSAGMVEVRLVLAGAGARSLRVRTERVARDDVPVRAVIMLRDLVADLGAPAGAPPARAPEAAPAAVLTTPARSAGKATLLVNATLYGGLVGFSVQRASGSDDPQLLYPLLAVGAGIGLGASVIVAEEWDVGVGDAWFLSSGAWWPTLAGHLIWQGRFAQSGGSGVGDEWSFGLIGGTAGLTIATMGLSLHPIGDGGALLAHSGGGLGMVFGGLVDMAVRGNINETPFSGAGYGAGLGWLAAAAVATQVEVAPTRVLTVDLGALVGGLGGAALGSPLLFSNLSNPTPGKQRGWVAATAGGTVLGAGTAFYLSRDAHPAPRPREPAQKTGLLNGMPMLGPIGESAIGTRSAPVLGVGWQAILD
jgi:hypothetical protein